MKPLNTVKLTSTLCLLGLTFACAPSDDDQPAPEMRSGLLVQSEVQWTEEVAGFDYVVERVSCEGEAIEPATYRATIGPEGLTLPSGIPAFEKQPFDPESEHMFADHLFVLPAGCYDVSATPIDEHGDPSEICYEASKKGVVVNDGLTTEILLISQCLGPARGGLDAIIALNNPPVIEDLEFDPSKFVSSCEGVEICVSASDPENDPLEFVWSQVSGPEAEFGPEQITTTHHDGVTRQCVLIQPGEIESYEFNVTVYDLAWYEDDLVRIEQLLAEQGEPHPSRDDLTFPLHAAVGCPVQGRSLVIMMTLYNQPGMVAADARKLIRNAVDWVHGSGSEPKVLVVLDDAHHGEQPIDALFVRGQMIAAGYSDVDFRLEPAAGLTLSDIEDYDVVWFSNPGWPMDDPATQSALLRFRAQGGGLVLQGDDMGHFATSPTLMQPLTYLRYLNNGTMSCGLLTDNNLGASYTVTLDGPADHPVLEGLAGLTFKYGNDIDHTRPLGLGEQVLASAKFTRGHCSVDTSAIVAIDPLHASPWSP